MTHCVECGFPFFFFPPQSQRTFRGQLESRKYRDFPTPRVASLSLFFPLPFFPVGLSLGKKKETKYRSGYAGITGLSFSFVDATKEFDE